MNNLLPVLASMSVGGIIGYSTNWIAIKMLFRPLHEVRVLGIRIPFTPGVIPKQRKALGTSIGETVENYLLTHDSVNETINSASFQSAIKELIEKNLYMQTKSAETLCQLFTKSNIDINSISTSLHSITLNNRKAFVKVISKFCDLIVKKLRLITIKSLIKVEKPNFRSELKNKITILLNSFVQNFTKKVGCKPTLGDLLGIKTRFELESLAYKSTPVILEKLSYLVEKQKVKDYIYSIVDKFLSGSFLGNMVKNLVPEESLKDIITKSLKTQLADESTAEDIRKRLPEILEAFYSTNLSEVISRFEESENNITELTALIITDMVSLILDQNKEATIIDILEALDMDIEDIIKAKLLDEFNHLVDNKKLFLEKTSPIINRALSIKMSEISKIILTYIDTIISFILEAIVKIVDIYGERVLEAFDVKKMVEDQIEKLDLLQVEDIILSVMNNQLKAITWFGLLLGALLGLLMPYINSLLS